MASVCNKKITEANYEKITVLGGRQKLQLDDQLKQREFVAINSDETQLDILSCLGGTNLRAPVIQVPLDMGKLDRLVKATIDSVISTVYANSMAHIQNPVRTDCQVRFMQGDEEHEPTDGRSFKLGMPYLIAPRVGAVNKTDSEVAKSLVDFKQFKHNLVEEVYEVLCHCKQFRRMVGLTEKSKFLQALPADL